MSLLLCEVNPKAKDVHKTFHKKKKLKTEQQVKIFETYKMTGLKCELNERRVSTIGNKSKVDERLLALIEGDLLLEDNFIAGEELDYEEDDLIDEEQISLNNSPAVTNQTGIKPKNPIDSATSLENNDATEDSVTKTNSILRRAKEENNSVTTPTKKPLKRKRNISFENPSEAVEQAVEASAARKIRKLSKQERLELRGRRFNIDTNITDENAAEARAPVNKMDAEELAKNISALPTMMQNLSLSTD